MGQWIDVNKSVNIDVNIDVNIRDDIANNLIRYNGLRVIKTDEFRKILEFQTINQFGQKET